MTLLRFERETRRWPAVGVWPLAGLAVWATLVGVFMLVKPGGGDATLCVFRNVTGVPCPTCGSTRAALAAVGGRPLEAIMLNPFVCVAALVGGAWLTLRLGFGRRCALDIPSRHATVVWIAIAVLFGANWVYVIQGHA